MGHVVANLAIMMVPGLLVAMLNRIRPGLVPLRAAIWLFATLMFSAPLLILPVAAWTGFLLAAGLGRMVARIGATLPPPSTRVIRASLGVMTGVLILIAAATTGREAIAEYWAESAVAQSARRSAERSLTRDGHCPCRKPESPGLSPRYDPTAQSMGPARREV